MQIRLREIEIHFLCYKFQVFDNQGLHFFFLFFLNHGHDIWEYFIITTGSKTDAYFQLSFAAFNFIRRCQNIGISASNFFYSAHLSEQFFYSPDYVSFTSYSYFFNKNALSNLWNCKNVSVLFFNSNPGKYFSTRHPSSIFQSIP